MRVRYLTVPHNMEGITEYQNGIEHSENMSVYKLPEDQFLKLTRNNVFMLINENCGLLIDDYESEIIDEKNVLKCLNSKIVDQNLSKVFYKALLEAKDNRTFVGLDF